MPPVGRLVQPADQLALVVGLADLDVEAQLGAELAALLDQARVGGGAVDVGLAGAEAAEVGAVEHQDRGGSRGDLPVGGEQHGRVGALQDGGLGRGRRGR